MYTITIEAYFSAAHNLRDYRGKCEKLHGHNWKVEIAVAKDTLDKAGMVMDFKVLKRHANDVLKKLDHQYLNDLAYFKKTNPTSENIARYLYVILKAKIKDLRMVTVWESENSLASYHEE